MRRFKLPHIFFDAGRDHRDSVLLAGGGRSGTTWLSDVLNWRNGYRVMYEPFHAKRVPICAAFRPHQYIRPDNDDVRYLEPARQIFTGRIHNGWVDQQTRGIFARKRLIKDVRLLLSLRWIYEHFPGMPIVVIMRHPCATALSRLQMQWEGDFSNFLEQPELMTDWLDPFRDELQEQPDPFLRHVLLWCVEYTLMVRPFRKGEVYFAFYERLCTSPEADLPALCGFVGAKYDPRMLEALSVPSMQATRARRLTPSEIIRGGDLVSSWRSHVTPQRYDAARKMLRRFGLDEVYGDSDMPDVDALTRLMRP